MKNRFSKIFICAFLVMAIAFTGCVDGKEVQQTQVEPTPSPTPTIRPADTVSFVAAGDNLIHGSIYLQAARRSTNGGYDFDYAYENTEDYFDDFDVAFINQETLVNDAYEPSHYPQFSTPIALGEKVLEMGFDVIGTSNNHSYDKGVKGIKSRCWQTGISFQRLGIGGQGVHFLAFCCFSMLPTFFDSRSRYESFLFNIYLFGCARC